MNPRLLITMLFVCGLYGAAPASAVTTADNASKAPESKAVPAPSPARPASAAANRESSKEREAARAGASQPKR